MNLDDSLGYLLNHAGRRLSCFLSLKFQPYDVTPELAVKTALNGFSGTQATQFKDYLRLLTDNMNLHINELEK